MAAFAKSGDVNNFSDNRCGVISGLEKSSCVRPQPIPKRSWKPLKASNSVSKTRYSARQRWQQTLIQNARPLKRRQRMLTQSARPRNLSDSV
jgi:hypothetical protein